MAQVRSHRVSVQHPGTPRSQSSSLASTSSFARPRRININLPKHSTTAEAFHSQITATPVQSRNRVQEERERYAELVLNHATSEAILKMPNVATKPRSVVEIFEPESSEHSNTKVICRLPAVAPAPHSNLKVSMDIPSRSISSSPSFSNQRPGLDRGRSSQNTNNTGNSTSLNMAPESEKDELNAKRSSMNPLAATFTPTFPKPTLSDCATSDHSSDSRPTPSRRGTADSRESMITGLGISSPSGELSPRQQKQWGLSINTTAISPATLTHQDRPTFAESPPMTANSLATTMTTTAEFDLEEFRVNLMRQISDNLETGLTRHFSKIASATSSMPLSPTSQSQTAESANSVATSGSNASMSASAEEVTIIQLKKLLRNTNTELGRLKEKNQELRETNHKLERQHLEATHQVARLQDFESNNQFLLTRVKELEASSSSSSDSALETASMNGYRRSGHHNGINNINSSAQTQQIQKLMRDIATVTSERDALKIRSWELEKKPFAHQEVRSTYLIDLENERNRLIEELSQKTVAMEDLWNKNEALMLRAKEYEKRVWELEGQVAALEADCASLPQIRSELVDMEARAEAADALVEKLQDMEGQVALVKSLQERIHELETTNAELDHSNWDLSEKLNIANNQHALLTKEFESFRSKDKDDRRLEFLAARNRELETLLAEQTRISPDYKEEYNRVSSELEKLKIRMPQLEGQAKQVALLRSKTLQLEKQIKTMESLEPRLEEMQQLHERNLFLESELGELEHLRAREMELEHELEDAKSKLIQLETNKTRMNSFSGLKQFQTRARSGSVAQHSAPLPFQNLKQQSLQQDESRNEISAEDLRIKTVVGTPPSHLGRSSQSISSMDAILSPRSPKREFPPATFMSAGTPATSMWPSGRSSMSMSSASQRMSTSSSTSTVMSSSSIGQFRSHQQEFSTPVSPEESADEEEKKELKALKSMEVTEEPDSFVDTGVAQEVIYHTPNFVIDRSMKYLQPQSSAQALCALQAQNNSHCKHRLAWQKYGLLVKSFEFLAHAGAQITTAITAREIAS
ncbi:hypothetical protein BGX26_011603 [Mortierella sp. AD094]|nr:hypothetical protein BGX26_011603 [Mortierella sp. AD094]